MTMVANVPGGVSVLTLHCQVARGVTDPTHSLGEKKLKFRY